MQFVPTFLLGVLLLIAPAFGASAPTAVETPDDQMVRLGDRNIIEIHRGLKAFSAAARAHNVSRRLLEIAGARPLPTLKVEESELSSDIMVGDQVLMSVFDADAAAVDKPRAALAVEDVRLLDAALAHYQVSHSREALLGGIARTGATLVAIIALLALFERIYRRLRARFLRKADETIADVERKSFSLVRANYLRVPLLATLNAIRLTVWGLLVYAALSLSLSYFPQTRRFGEHLADLVMGPLGTLGGGLLDAIPGLLVIAVIVLITRWLTRSAAFLFDRVADGRIQLEGFFPEWANPTRRILNLLIVVGAVMVAYPYIPGSDSAAFKGVSIFLGVLFSLGSSGVISNVVTGFMITYMRAFKVGDVVKIGDTIGVVVESSLLVTRLRTIRNIEITVPNSQILNGQVTNYSVTGNPTVSTQLTIGYDTPWRQVHAMLLGAAANTPGIVAQPAPFVLQTALEDFYIRYELMCVVENPARMPHILSALHQNILDTFNDYAVQIMSPHFIDNPSSPALVARDQWFNAPARPPQSP